MLFQRSAGDLSTGGRSLATSSAPGSARGSRRGGRARRRPAAWRAAPGTAARPGSRRFTARSSGPHARAGRMSSTAFARRAVLNDMRRAWKELAPSNRRFGRGGESKRQLAHAVGTILSKSSVPAPEEDGQEEVILPGVEVLSEMPSAGSLSKHVLSTRDFKAEEPTSTRAAMPTRSACAHIVRQTSRARDGCFIRPNLQNIRYSAAGRGIRRACVAPPGRAVVATLADRAPLWHWRHADLIQTSSRRRNPPRAAAKVFRRRAGLSRARCASPQADQRRLLYGRVPSARKDWSSTRRRRRHRAYFASFRACGAHRGVLRGARQEGGHDHLRARADDPDIAAYNAGYGQTPSAWP